MCYPPHRLLLLVKPFKIKNVKAIVVYIIYIIHSQVCKFTRVVFIALHGARGVWTVYKNRDTICYQLNENRGTSVEKKLRIWIHICIISPTLNTVYIFPLTADAIR